MTILSVSIFIICASQNSDLFDSVYHKILRESTAIYLKRTYAVRTGVLVVPTASRTHTVFVHSLRRSSIRPETTDKKETPLG